MSTFLSILPIIIALVLYFTGIPIAYALFAAALTYFGFIDTTTVPYLLMQKFITSTQSFPFLAIPFFIMCGSIMNYGGISARRAADGLRRCAHRASARRPCADQCPAEHAHGRLLRLG